MKHNTATTVHKLRNRSEEGFTMIEILMSIGIIGIISAVVIIAINPQYQLCQSQDAERNSNAREIRNALVQYVIDNSSGFNPATTFNNPIPEGLGNADEICIAGASDTSDCVDLFRSDRISEVYANYPDQDPDETDADHSGYKIYKEDDFYFVTATHAGGCSATGSESSS